MKYETFKFSEKDLIVCRAGVEGFQRKFVTKNGEYFIKEQCNLNGCYMQDWKVEVIASILCKQFGFRHMEQKPCTLEVNGVETNGVVSINYGNLGYRFVSFECLLEQINKSSNESWFVNASVPEKIGNMAVMVHRACKTLYKSDVNVGLIFRYMLECAIIDILVYNNDRHTRNYSIAFGVDGKIITAPIHDCGMGLFENDASFIELQTWRECNGSCYVAPFGEDAFDLLEILDKAYNVKDMLRKSSRPVIPSSCFPSKKAKQYFKEICDCIW